MNAPTTYTPADEDRVDELRRAARIRAYWAERGHDVRVSIEPIAANLGYRFPCHRVISDMIDGLPRSMKRGQR